VLGKTLPFDSLDQLRAKLFVDHPSMAEEGIALAGALDPAPKGGDVSGAIVYPIEDFYLTNPIARSSPTMQRCSAELIKGETFAEAAE
jgi:NADH-quinone oxidoreductase subunit G